MPGKMKLMPGRGPVSHTAPAGGVAGGVIHSCARRRNADASIMSDPRSLPASRLRFAVSISTCQ